MLNAVLLFLDIGGPEMILILVVALLVFGGDKLPELARGLGKGIRDFKDAANGVKDEFHDTISKLEDTKSQSLPSVPANESMHQIGSGSGSGNDTYSNPGGYHTTSVDPDPAAEYIDFTLPRSNPYPGHSDHPDHASDYKEMESYTIVPPVTEVSAGPVPAEIKPFVITPAHGTIQFEDGTPGKIQVTEPPLDFVRGLDDEQNMVQHTVSQSKMNEGLNNDLNDDQAGTGHSFIDLSKPVEKV